MDDFVALTERYGLKPRGKSAPMAALKRSGFNHNSVKASPFDSGDNANAELTLNDSNFDFLNPGGFDDFLVFDELNKTKSCLSDESSCVGVLFTESIPGFGGSGQPSNKFVNHFMKHAV